MSLCVYILISKYIHIFNKLVNALYCCNQQVYQQSAYSKFPLWFSFCFVIMCMFASLKTNKCLREWEGNLGESGWFLINLLAPGFHFQDLDDS